MIAEMDDKVIKIFTKEANKGNIHSIIRLSATIFIILEYQLSNFVLNLYLNFYLCTQGTQKFEYFPIIYQCWYRI